jgi:hypothetical protein
MVVGNGSRIPSDYPSQRGEKMKKAIAYFGGSFVLATAIAFGVSFQSVGAAAESCQGKCNRAKTACLNTATTQSQQSQCNKSYQGCISSCK